jgi:sugar (pentulose or hexulose) kinase
VKAAAFDYAGHEVCSHEIPVELLRLHRDWVEQDMDGLWRTVKACLSEVLRKLQESKRSLAGIGITSTGDGTWLMDRDGHALRGGILWCDGRAREIVERWHGSDVAQRAFAICGTSVFTGSQAAQLTWLREHEPDVLHKAHVIFHAKDWLFYKMTGVATSDETDESLTMLRMPTRQYDLELFRIFGIEDLFSKFPAVKPTEENVASILPSVAGELGVAKDTLIGSGPMDVAACALGTAAIEHGQACSILGTAGIHQVIMAEPNLQPDMVGMTLCHGVKGRWMRMMAAMTATPNLEWFLKVLGAGISNADGGVYSRLEAMVDSAPVGSEGVMFHPIFSPAGSAAHL